MMIEWAHLNYALIYLIIVAIFAIAAIAGATAIIVWVIRAMGGLCV